MSIVDGNGNDDGWQRRQAIQVAAMLPEDTASARRVLELAMQLVDGFLSAPAPAHAPGLVLALVVPQPGCPRAF